MGAVGDAVDDVVNFFSFKPRVERMDPSEKVEVKSPSSRDLTDTKVEPNFGQKSRVTGQLNGEVNLTDASWLSSAKTVIKNKLKESPHIFVQSKKGEFVEQKLSHQEQKAGFSEFLSQSSSFAMTGDAAKDKSNTAKREALAGVLAELPDGASAGNLVKDLSSIKADPKNPNYKDAQTLALISKHLADLRKSDNSPETKDRHRALMSDLIQTSGLSKKHADIAVGVLDRIPPANQANVIQLALGLARSKDVDILKTLAGEKKLLAEKSGLSLTEADQARKDIIKAGFEHLQASGNKDFTGALAVLNKVTDADGKINLKQVQEQLAKNILENPQTAEELAQRNEAHTKREAALQSGIKDAAHEKVRNEINKKLRESALAQWFPGMAMKKANKAYAKALRSINNWQPGAVGKKKIERQLYAQMNKAYGENQSRSIDEMKKAVTTEVGSRLVEKFTPKVVNDLNSLASLIKAGGIELPKQVQPLRAGHLRDLEKFKNLDIAIF